MKIFLNTVIVSILLISSCWADQNNPELEVLFTRLKETQDAEDVKIISQKIWNNWYQNKDPEIEFLMDQGELSMRRSDYANAIEIYTQIINNAPQFAEGWNRRATIFYLMGEFGLSTKDVAKTLELEPRHYGALSGQGFIYIELENIDLALEYFKKALEINPHMPHIRKRVDELRKQLNIETI